MKVTRLSVVSMTSVLTLLAIPAYAADPKPAAPAPISTTTDSPTKAAPAPAAGTQGQTTATQPSVASPTGAVKNMAPVRGNPKDTEAKPAPKLDTSSASGLTTPGASSGSSLGSGSNSPTVGTKKGDEKAPITK